MKNLYQALPSRNSFLEQKLTQLKTWEPENLQASPFFTQFQDHQTTPSPASEENQEEAAQIKFDIEDVDKPLDEQPLKAQQIADSIQPEEKTSPDLSLNFGSGLKNIKDIKPFKPKFLQQPSFGSEFAPSALSARSEFKGEQSNFEDPDYFFPLSQKAPI